MQGSRRGGQGTWQWRLSSASVPSQAACSLSPSFQLNSATQCAPAPAAPPNSPLAAPRPRQRVGRIRGGTNRHSRAALCGQAAAVHRQGALGTCAGAPPAKGKRWSETGRLGELLNGIVDCERGGPTPAVPEWMRPHQSCNTACMPAGGTLPPQAGAQLPMLQGAERVVVAAQLKGWEQLMEAPNLLAVLLQWSRAATSAPWRMAQVLHQSTLPCGTDKWAQLSSRVF